MPAHSIRPDAGTDEVCDALRLPQLLWVRLFCGVVCGGRGAGLSSVVGAPELAVVEAEVKASLVQQRFVGASFDYLSVVYDEHQAGVSNCT